MNRTKQAQHVALAKKRVRSRGAAMVEAAIVMPIFICCWGVTMLAGGARYKKLQVQQEARQNFFTQASAGCTGSGGPTIPSLSSNPGADPRTAAGTNAGAAPQDAVSSTQQFFTVGGNVSGQWSWSHGFQNQGAVWDTSTRSVAMSAHSFYFCNETSHTGLLGFFTYAIDEIRQLVPNSVSIN